MTKPDFSGLGRRRGLGLLKRDDGVVATVTFAVDNQSMTFGARTLSGAGGVDFAKATNSTNPIASIGALGGTNAADWTASFSGGTVTITPAANYPANGPYSLTLTCYDGAGQTGNSDAITISITTEATTYSVRSEAEYDAATNDIITNVVSNAFIKLRDDTGRINLNDSILLSLDGRDMLGCTISNENGTGAGPTVDFENERIFGCSNITFDGLDFRCATDLHDIMHVVESASKPFTNFVIRNCTFDYDNSSSYTPNSDFSTSGFPFGDPAGNTPCGIRMTDQGLTGQDATGVIIEDNEIRWGSNAIWVSGATDLKIRRNKIGPWYNGGVVITKASTGTKGVIYIEDNEIFNPTAIFSDTNASYPALDNPHPDAIRFQGFNGATTDEEIHVNRNIIYTGDARGQTFPVFIDDWVSSGPADTTYGWTGEIRGNLCIDPGTGGIFVAQPKNLRVEHNTVVNNDGESGTYNQTISLVGDANHAAIGDQSVRWNAADSVNVSGISAVTTGNVDVDSGAATYDTAFAKTGSPTSLGEWDPTTRAEALALFAMLTSGDLDNTINSGAVGSGVVTFGTPLSGVAGSFTEVAPPELASSDPADGSTDHPVADNILIDFTQDIAGATAGGEFYLYTTAGPTLVETFDVDAGTGDNSGTISISGRRVTINPGADLAGTTAHSIRWNAGAVEDATSGVGVAANTGDTLLNFTTASAASFSPVNLTAYNSTLPSGFTTSNYRGLFLVLRGHIDANGGFVYDTIFSDNSGNKRIDLRGDALLRIENWPSNCINATIGSAFPNNNAANQTLFLTLDMSQSTGSAALTAYLDGTALTPTISNYVQNTNLGSFASHELWDYGSSAAPFEGQVDFMAMHLYTAAQLGSIPDITSASVRANYSEANYQTTCAGHQFFQQGPATKWTAGTNDGTEADFGSPSSTGVADA